LAWRVKDIFTLELSRVALFNRTQFSSMTSLHTARHTKHNFFLCCSQSHCLLWLLLAVEDYALDSLNNRHNLKEQNRGMLGHMEAKNIMASPLDFAVSFPCTPLLSYLLNSLYSGTVISPLNI